MDKKQIDSLTSNEITCTLVGTVIGIYLLRAAGDVTAISQQDGWISMLLGGLYPLFVVLISTYIIKKHPRDNILILSKKYLGSFMGNILNLMFFIQFMLYLTFITASIINLLETYGISFLNPLKTVMLIVAIAAYTSSNGIKAVAKINIIVLYFLFFVILLLLTTLDEGSILNVMPFGGSGVSNILKGVTKSVQSYSTIEVILLMHPFARKNVSVKSAAFKAVLIICIIYTLVIFITIYYLGIELIPKAFWPSILVFHSIHIPLINNFVTVFMFIWSIIFLKSASNQYFFVTFIVGHYIKAKPQKICLFLFPIVVPIILLFSTNPKYGEYFSSLSSYIVIFNMLYISIIAFLIFLKEKKLKNSMKESTPEV